MKLNKHKLLSFSFFLLILSVKKLNIAIVFSLPPFPFPSSLTSLSLLSLSSFPSPSQLINGIRHVGISNCIDPLLPILCEYHSEAPLNVKMVFSVLKAIASEGPWGAMSLIQNRNVMEGFFLFFFFLFFYFLICVFILFYHSNFSNSFILFL